MRTENTPQEFIRPVLLAGGDILRVEAGWGYGKRHREKSEDSWRNGSVSRYACAAPALVRLSGKRAHSRTVSRRISYRFARNGYRRARRSATALVGKGLNADSAR